MSNDATSATTRFDTPTSALALEAAFDGGNLTAPTTAACPGWPSSTRSLACARAWLSACPSGDAAR